MARYPSIRIEGGLFGPDVFDELRAGALPGQRPIDFAVSAPMAAPPAAGNRVGEARPARGETVPPPRRTGGEIAEAFSDARRLWTVFGHRRARIGAGDPGTRVTRDAWMIPFLGLLDYELSYNRRAYDVDGLTFAISHRAGASATAPPVHVVGVGRDVGRPPATGRPRLAPHALVQEYLNRTEALWGLVTNGSTLRLLRECASVRRQAYVEFDLPAMLEEQRFEDFEALYRLLHRTRLPRNADGASMCLLERYYAHGVEQGGRVRERLREGVERCIERLAAGFLDRPENEGLRRRAAPEGAGAGADHLTAEEFYRALLTLVYRLLFLLVAEDRGLLGAGRLYASDYGVGRLRSRLDRPGSETGRDHDDLWQALRVLWRVLVSDEPEQALGGRPLAALLDLPVLNGDLFKPGPLDSATIGNRALLAALGPVFRYRDGPSSPPRRVNYGALDVEELGSVYESLLDFTPLVERDADGRPAFRLAPGSERKSTGSFYTPPTLVEALVKSTLDPVLEARLEGCATPAERERAVLGLRVCDPACGSGHFLLAAARRLGLALARLRTGESAPGPERLREAVRDVVSHSIYGVDRNPLAVDLCRVALWIESHSAGRPLTFLDHRIRCGDSLAGVLDADVLSAGIPDGAFAPLAGDDRAAARRLKARNRREREDGQRRLPWDGAEALADFADFGARVGEIADDSPEAVRRKRALFEGRYADPVRRRLRQACDLWTAAFFQALRPGGQEVTTAALADHLDGAAVDPRVLARAESLAAEHRFFHWRLEFPEVFAGRADAGPGFDVVLGNPPWVSYTGRQKAVVSPGGLRSLRHRFPGVARWPAAHTAFLILSAELLAKRGRAGLVLPRQVGDLAAYGPARAAVTERARLCGPVVDAGEDAFDGVAQAVGMFSLVAGADGAHGSEAPWPVVAPPWTAAAGGRNGRSAVDRRAPVRRPEPVRGPRRQNGQPARDLPDLLEMLAEQPRFEPATFADPGVHSGNVARKLIAPERPADAAGYAPVREGRDVAAYLCRTPRKWLWTAPALLQGEYCRIRPERFYRSVPIVLRQTADRPIAARHRDATYFRNSLLACAGVDGAPDTVVVAFLNSALYALLHRTASEDAKQKTFPQVKIRHLRALPAVPVRALDRGFDGSTAGDALDAAVQAAEAAARAEARVSRDVLERIERTVLFAFDLDPDLAPALLEAVR